MPDIVGVFGKFPSLMRLRVDRGLLEALASFWDPTHYCFSIGEVDLVPTLEEYAGLLQLDSPFSETPVIPIQSPRSNRVLEKYLGLTSAVLRPEIIRPEETWRKANISLDLLTKYFSWSDFPVELARDFIAGKKGWKKFRINCLSRSPLQETGRGGLDVLHTAPSALVLQSPTTFLPPPDLLITFERHTVRQTVNDSTSFHRTTAVTGRYISLTCPLSYYPSLALRQFGGVQYPPRLGDLDAVTFDYIPGEDMWRLLFRIEDIWGGRLSEMVLIEGGLHGDSSVTPDFVEWREGWSPSFTLRPTVRPGASYSSVSRSLRASAPTGQSERVAVLERELEEARTELSSLRLARASEREESAARVESMRSTLHHNSVAVANLRRDLEVQRGNVSTLRTMNDFIREQLEISEAAKDHMEETLTETLGAALVDPSTGRPHDIVALQRALDESEAALTSARTSIGAMRVQISVLQGDNGVLQTEVDLVHDALESNASWLNQEGFPVVTALHQIKPGDGLFGCQGSRCLGGAR
uniref:DUF7745 domain-containing protein n=1 Tax=Fagus sylvatica TaxID=28930 RepID=A0A2N9ERJ6_FAGSY